MSQSLEIEPYEEVVNSIHYNTPVGIRSSSPHDSPLRSSPPLSQSNGPRQTNSLLQPPPQPALRSYQLADPEPWQECAATTRPACDGQKDRRTHGRTDTLRSLLPALA